MNSLSVQCLQQHDNPAGTRFCQTCGIPIKANAPTEWSPEDSGDLPEIVGQGPSRSAEPKPTFRCAACGQSQTERQVVCTFCGSIKPIDPDYAIDPSVFQWSLDGQAMARLRSIKPLVAVAQSVSSRVGKPWIEANFNGIRLGPKQMPQIYAMAVQAARILGLKRMPSIYVSGARPWDALTFGSDDDAFVVMGSALVSCFQKGDLMFLFARQMGHILAGHALWKTVIQFLLGEQNAVGGMMRNGVAGLLDPTRLIEGAIELPLIAWARQAEITADRAGLLVSGGLEAARRTLIMWSLKSPLLYRQINLQAWLEQQEMDTADSNIRLAEAVSTATPYLTRRLKLIQEYDRSLIVQQFRQHVMTLLPKRPSTTAPLAPASSPQPGASGTQDRATHSRPTATASHPNLAATLDPLTVAATGSLPAASGQALAASKNNVQFVCPACQRNIQFDPGAAGEKSQVAIRCPHADCGKTTLLKTQTSPGAGKFPNFGHISDLPM